MSTRIPRGALRLRAIRTQEDGNVLAFTALAIVALIGMVSLVIDIGFTVGQRRFMQNGADAAALAVARQLAENVSPHPISGPWPQGIPHFFNVSDAAARATAEDIASRNQNPGITGRTTSFTVTLEYCVAASDSSYSTASGCPSPNSWVTSPTAGGRVPDGTYKVRVTVESTITTLFGNVIGQASTTTSGQAIAVIRGICPETEAVGNSWPFTLWDQQDFGTEPDKLFMLWGSNPPKPPGADANWKNVIDLSPERRWCDGVPDDYNWAQGPNMAAMVPSGTNCTPNLTDATQNFTGTDNTWNRGMYAEDPRGGCFTGNSINPDNLAAWTATTFSGTLAVGMKVPLYPKSGDGGNNVSSAIYGPSANPCSGSYFFQGVTAVDPDHPQWGRYRDVVVFTYGIPAGQGGHFYKLTGGPSATPVWSDDTSGASMGRVTLMRLLHFRIYENYDNAASRVYGRVVSPVFPPGDNMPLCGSGPGIYGNVVQLGS